jgi:hypothetical protein
MSNVLSGQSSGPQGGHESGKLVLGENDDEVRIVSGTGTAIVIAGIRTN